jgi:ABC-type polysaccharide/polyol phosphate export permease
MKKKPAVRRWVERGFIEDLFSLREQSHLALQLYLVRVAELRRNSGLGLVAPFISVLVHVALLGSVMSLVFQEPIQKFIPFFAISFCTWQTISISVSESAFINERAAQYLSFPRISGFIVHYVNALELLVAMALKIVAAMIIIACIDRRILEHASYIGVLLGIVLIAISMFVWSLPISHIFDRYRFLRNFLAQLLFAVYILTPVMWLPGRLSSHRWVVEINPVFHLIEVVRAPLLNGAIPVFSIFVTVALIVCGLLLSAALFERNRELVVYRWIA